MQPAATWRKVHIIGGAGSGKSTLARRLSVELGAPAYDLDCIAYEGGAGPKQSEAERRATVQRIAAEPKRVTEGIYLWWIEDLLCAADVNLWLDIPYHVAAWRIVRRHIAASLRGINRHPGWWRLARFIVATRSYYRRHTPVVPADACDDLAITRAATARALSPYRYKVVHSRRG